MSQALSEKPNAEVAAQSSGASIILNGRYLPPPQDEDGKLWVRTSSLVQANREELYELWRDVERAPLWQEQVISVTPKSARVSHWVMRSNDSTIEWDAEVLADEPGRRIAWRSSAGDFDNAGEVLFEEATGGRGTVVTVLQEFRMGKLASAWQTLVGRNPKQAVTENLRHFKALVETGEIPRNNPQPHGDRGVVDKAKKSLYGEAIPTPPATKAS